jgi:zinc transport system permease protein
LFGDVLAVGKSDLALIWGGAAFVGGLVAWRWQKLLTATLSPDLAWASGINPEREKQVLMIALALVVAVAIKIVGAILIGALLIIPAAAARPLARTPEQMVIGAAVVGSLAAISGLWGAWIFDTPAGPSIVCSAAIFFVITMLFRGMRRG